jgi:(p)ppGpp synthase/HD superfamily hydrolase
MSSTKTEKRRLPNPVLSERFRRALAYAARLHARQARKGTARPYLAHLLGVTATVLTHGGDEDEAIAALLHDAVEDQGGRPTLQKIRRQFGRRVARIVEDCSDADTVPKPPWIERKKKYLRHLGHANRSACLVSAADKLYNAREVLDDLRVVGERVFDRFQAKKQRTLWYYGQVERIVRRKIPAALASELRRVVQELQRESRRDHHGD